MLIRLIISILFCAAATFASAQVRTLQWCLQQGLENNFSIKVADNDLLTAKDNATRANAGMLPTVSASAGYNIDLNDSRSNSRSTGITSSSSSSLDQTLQARVGVTWTAFDGFGLQARYSELKLLKQQSDVKRRMAVEDLISDITAEYYNNIHQAIRLRNYLNSMELSRERLRIVEERYNIGSFSRYDYMQAKVDFNSDSANFMKQQEALLKSNIQINRLMNISSANENLFQPADTTIAVSTILDYETLRQDLFKYNTDIQNSNIVGELSNEALRKALARNYPSVKLNASYGYNHNRYEVGSNKWSDRWGPSVGVTIGFDIYDGSRRSAQRAARRDVENSGLVHQDLLLSLEAQFDILKQSHISNLRILSLEQQNLATAKENYSIARERYLLGNLSGFEMREAQQSLLNAEERILKAAYDAKMCEISLMLISGGIEKYLY